jgi:hypothetical protein
MADTTDFTDTSDPDEMITTEEEDIDVVKDLELQVLRESLQGKSANTIKSYTQTYEALYKALGKEVRQSSQKLIVQTADKLSGNPNTRAAFINVGILCRRLYNLDVKELEKARRDNKKGIAEHTKATNNKLDLPTVKEFEEHIDDLYQKKQYKHFVVNFLLHKLCCRNQDLNFNIVMRQKDVPKDNKNYMWLGRNKATLYRRDYKTDKTYGEKINILTDKRLLTALKKLQQANEQLVPNDKYMGYYIKQYSFNQLGEGNIFKMLVDDARKSGDLIRLHEMSKLRGSDLCNIVTSYNVQQPPK